MREREHAPEDLAEVFSRCIGEAPIVRSRRWHFRRVSATTAASAASLVFVWSTHSPPPRPTPRRTGFAIAATEYLRSTRRHRPTTAARRTSKRVGAATADAVPLVCAAGGLSSAVLARGPLGSSTRRELAASASRRPAASSTTSAAGRRAEALAQCNRLRLAVAHCVSRGIDSRSTSAPSARRSRFRPSASRPAASGVGRVATIARR